jgi:hypothetical protein
MVPNRLRCENISSCICSTHALQVLLGVHFRKEKVHQFVKLEIGALLDDINCPIY